jgi:hypothetical protein
VSSTIAALCEAERLPGLLDAEAMIPPTGKGFVRQVPGFSLWVWYDLPDEQHVRFITVTRTPPTPMT